MGQIRDLMTGNPTTCEPSATIVDIAKVMATEDVGPVPIVEGERVVGIVTDRDIVVRVVAEGKDVTSTTAGEIASSDLITLTPDSDLQEAERLMSQNQVRRLPVVDGDRIVGIVAQADIARAAEEERTGEVVQQISR
jgi:CBS domain-containing protein